MSKRAHEMTFEPEVEVEGSPLYCFFNSQNKNKLVCTWLLQYNLKSEDRHEFPWRLDFQEPLTMTNVNTVFQPTCYLDEKITYWCAIRDVLSRISRGQIRLEEMETETEGENTRFDCLHLDDQKKVINEMDILIAFLKETLSEWNEWNAGYAYQDDSD